MDKYIGKLVEIPNPNDLKIALENSFSAKRGEFVKIRHKESNIEPETYVRKDCFYIKKQYII